MAKPRRDNVVVGLDIGTTKICAIVGEVTPEGIDIIGIGTAPSKGLRKGVVINIESTVTSIKRAIEEAELMAGCEIGSVYAGIAVQGVIDAGKLSDTLVLGELSLSGDVRKVRGVLAAAEVARQHGMRRMLVAPGNADEAALVEALEVRAVGSLKDAVAFLRDGRESGAVLVPRPAEQPFDDDGLDLSDVRGQPVARRALGLRPHRSPPPGPDR